MRVCESVWDLGRASQAAKCLFRAEYAVIDVDPSANQREAGGTCPRERVRRPGAGDDQRGYRYRQRAEHRRQGLDEVVSHDARAGGFAKYGHRSVKLGEPIQHELGQEGIEVDEVPMHTPLATPASEVTAGLVSPLTPSRSSTRSAASKSSSRALRRWTPVGTAVPLGGAVAVALGGAGLSGHLPTIVGA